MVASSTVFYRCPVCKRAFLERVALLGHYREEHVA